MAKQVKVTRPRTPEWYAVERRYGKRDPDIDIITQRKPMPTMMTKRQAEAYAKEIERIHPFFSTRVIPLPRKVSVVVMRDGSPECVLFCDIWEPVAEQRLSSFRRRGWLRRFGRGAEFVMVPQC